MRTQQSKIVGQWESNPKSEILRITGYKKKTTKKKTRQSSNKQSTLKGTWKRKWNEAQTEENEGNNKDWSRKKNNRL